MSSINLLLVLVILVDKGIYAYSDITNNVSYIKAKQLFPLYQPLTIKHFAEKTLKMKVDREESFRIDAKNSMLTYPKEGLTFRQTKKPNVLIIIMDAWRYDMLNPETTPNCYAFSKEAQVFSNHFSGGNASRFGVFTLLYGVHGYYWQSFLAERRSSVLIDELQKHGYDFHILSSTRLTYPEFRKTAFINIPDKIYDNFEGKSSDVKDAQLAENYMQWLDTRKTKSPYFSFIFFDSPHGPYSFPVSYEKFKPSNKDINYLTLNKKDGTVLRNSYKNALLYDDSLVGEDHKQIESNKATR